MPICPRSSATFPSKHLNLTLSRHSISEYMNSKKTNDSNGKRYNLLEMCTETWRGAGVARSPSHESVTTDLSLFSVSSAASDARVLRMLACKAGQGPDPSIRVASPNPDGKASKRSSATLPLASGESGDACREVLAGCAALCAQLGLRRSFSAADVCQVHNPPPPRRRQQDQLHELSSLSEIPRPHRQTSSGSNSKYSLMSVLMEDSF
ncbi:hypothetical protein RR48_01934 [Papilio machaon]|uniref:Uncharacterized protein n=1 Tax=Papilio machaon TaxID=76193 RepID=A0A0N1I910_PAPMA|nr:hypothetical protein RR48_01934 [Papilio machaon]